MKLRLKPPPESQTLGFMLCALICALSGDSSWACVFLVFAMVAIDTTK